MSEAGSSSNDPSMDDILASIRKIISDDEARAQVSGGQGATAKAAPTTAQTKRDDVLLLTDLVEEPKGGARPTPLPLPRLDPASISDMPQPVVAAQPGEPGHDQALIAVGVAGVASSAFDRLSQAVQDSVPAPTAAHPGPTMGAGKTLEERFFELVGADRAAPPALDWLSR